MKSVLILFLSVTFLTSAQSLKGTWYFGDKAGISFNSGTAVPLLDGEMQSHEGCAAISDTQGNILFYTNGGPFANKSYIGGVWNKNHQLMPNGDLSDAASCNSASQSALIVPDPNDYAKYYVFTTDCQENNMAGGLRYHKVDMTLDSGLGDVTDKNMALAPSVVEGLTGAQHANGTDYWVVTSELNTNVFFAYQITSSGIEPAVSSAIGNNTNKVTGQMTISPDGTKLAFAAVYDTYLYDFDKATGVVSNFIALGVPSYGCSFSPDSQLLYANELSSPRRLHQFNLNAADIPASALVVGNNQIGSGNMQLAPDGKIYVATPRPTLGVINSPNTLGPSCNYDNNGFNLGGKWANMGLPNFVNQYDIALAVEDVNTVFNAIELFPNPTIGYSSIKIPEHLMSKYINVTVTDVLGRVVSEKTYIGEQNITLVLPEVKGVYMVSLMINNQTKTIKLIKR
ncbi:MAG: T9SS type A sorting domain-containing protein [Flavobacteriaceae bacterium]